MRGGIERIAIVLLAGAAATAFGQDPTMMQADTAFVRAVAHADRHTLEGLLDPTLTWITAAGKVQTKSQVLKELPQVAIGTDQKAESKGYTYAEMGDVQANLGRAHVLRVWVKRGGSWRAVVYQEVMSRAMPPTFTPGAGKDCENPCRSIAFTPKDETDGEVARAYSKLETAAHARDSAAFAPMVAEEFVAASSNSDRTQSKRSRMAEFDRAKDAGVAPTPLLSARMFEFGDAVLMLSEHKPDRGNPLRVTRIWVKRSGSWLETLSYQTAVQR
jgi:Domain of unknown function (DUF4440)